MKDPLLVRLLPILFTLPILGLILSEQKWVAREFLLVLFASFFFGITYLNPDSLHLLHKKKGGNGFWNRAYWFGYQLLFRGQSLVFRSLTKVFYLLLWIGFGFAVVCYLLFWVIHRGDYLAAAQASSQVMIELSDWLWLKSTEHKMDLLALFLGLVLSELLFVLSQYLKTLFTKKPATDKPNEKEEALPPFTGKTPESHAPHHLDQRHE